MVRKYKKWTKEEEKILKKLCKSKSDEKLSKLLKKTKISINKKRVKLRFIKKDVKSWKIEEINFIKKNYKTKSDEDIGKILNRSKDSIRAKRCRLKLLKTKLFLYKEIKFIKNNWKSKSDEEIAKILKTTKNVIHQKRLKLGLRKTKKRNHKRWKKEEMIFLKKYHKTKTYKWIAKKLGRSCISVRTKASKLNLKAGFRKSSGFKKNHKVPIIWLYKRRKTLIKKHGYNENGKINIPQGFKKGYDKRRSNKQFTKESREKQILPIKDTSIEIKLQKFLTELEIEFYTHIYRKEIKHAYRCDIWIPKYNLIIEADGDYWHGNPIKYSKVELSERQKKQQEKDNIRTKELLEKGFKVWRIWESEIKKMSLEDFKGKIKKLNI